MASYEETLAEELEVLESIYPDELEKISPTHLCLQIDPEVPVTTEPLSLKFTVKYPPEYPDVLPEISLDVLDGELEDSEREWLLEDLKVVGEESIGMAMVFTLASHLRETMSSLVARRVVLKQQAEDEKYRQLEEAQAARLRGTAVTTESFLDWRKTFLLEQKAQKEKEEDERLRALPPKEREEVKRSRAKLSGKQLFQKDKTLFNSDEKLGGDEDAVAVDFSQYSKEEREAARREEEAEENGLKVNYDSD